MYSFAVKTFSLRFIRLSYRKLKRGIEAIVYGLFDTLVLAGMYPGSKPDHVAIVHLELLGDMALWLPYGQALVRHFRAQGKRISLIIDADLLPLASAAFDEVNLVGVPKRAFLHSPLVRAHNLRHLRRLGCGLTIHPSNPRDGILMDATVRALGAPAVGFDAEFIDRPAFDRILSRRLYTQLIPALEGTHQHQHQQHQRFLVALGIAPDRVKPIDLKLPETPPLEASYWLLAPGASRAFRQWSAESFAKVALHIANQRPQWHCVLVGTAAERVAASTIAHALGERALNLVGQTDLQRLLELIAHANLVVGNDSAAGHLASLMGTPSVVIVGGGHWGRCYPYDTTEAPVRTLPHAVGVHMSCFGCDWLCRYTAREDKPFPCVDAVSVQAVTENIDEVLRIQGDTE